MASIEKLIDLARKTGDTLIVHDPSKEKDIVVLDIDNYIALREQSIRNVTTPLVKKTEQDTAVVEEKEIEKDAVSNHENEWHEIHDIIAKRKKEQFSQQLEHFSNQSSDNNFLESDDENEETSDPKKSEKNIEIVELEQKEYPASESLEEVIYEFPVEEPRITTPVIPPPPLPSIIPKEESVSDQLTTGQEKKQLHDWGSFARKRMQEGLSTYKKPQPIPNRPAPTDTFQPSVSASQEEDVFFDEPI